MTVAKLTPILLVVLFTGLQACATQNSKGPDTPYELTEDYLNNVIRYTVQRGDRLSDISLEFTGDIGRWQAIAAFNGIQNPKKIRAGDVLEIPTSLIPGYENKITPATSDPDSGTDSSLADTAVAESQLETGSGNATASTTALAVKSTVDNTAVDTGTDEYNDVVVTPVVTNRNFELSPIDPDSLPKPAANTINAQDAEVRVVGTYYPKGVYAQPATYAKLIMRVSPGTVFSLEREINDWYKVVTTRGTGYLRAEDGQIVVPENTTLNSAQADE